MFKNLQDELRRLSAQQTISVPLERDAEGYCDKECPDDNCFSVQDLQAGLEGYRSRRGSVLSVMPALRASK